jgi:nitrogen PTS system EIIA component
MTQLSELLDDGCVDLSLEKGRKAAILSRLIGMAYNAGAVSDQATLIQEILEREEQTSTAIGGGIAIPHKLSSCVTRRILGFGRCDEGAAFSAPDGRPVMMFFLLLAPEDAVTDHLRILSRLARFLHDPNFQNSLLDASSPEEIRNVFLAKEQE